MLFNIEYQPWLAASVDDSRPSLKYCNVTAGINGDLDQDHNGFIPGIMAATNGFILSVVPVKLSPDDIEGLVSPDALKTAVKLSKKLRLGEVSITLAANMITLSDDSRIPRFYEKNFNGTFPDWAPIVPDRRKPEKFDNTLMAICLEPRYLVDTIKSIGCRYASSGRGSAGGDIFPRLVIGKPNDSGIMIEPMIVEPVTAKIYKTFYPPYGLVMPMHNRVNNDNDPGKYWDQK